MDGSYCFYLEEQQTAACKCPDLHVGKRCEKSILYPIIQVENVHIETAIENLKWLEQQSSLSAKNYTRDERLIFRNYVLALRQGMAPSGKINQLQRKIIITRINQVYKKSKVYRLALVILECTRLVAENYRRVFSNIETTLLKIPLVLNTEAGSILPLLC